MVERVTDDAEHAEKLSQFMLDAKIQEIRAQKINLHNPSQICWCCGRQTPSPQHRWCDADCRDIWSEEND